MRKKEEFLIDFLKQGQTEQDSAWMDLFSRNSLLDQLLYYLDLSLLSHRAKVKILRSLVSEEVQELASGSLVVVLEDGWIKSKPYDFFLKAGSFIWTENTCISKVPLKVFSINPSGLEAILPWVAFKTEKQSLEEKENEKNFFKSTKGIPFARFIGQPIIVLSLFIALNFFVQSNSIKIANSGNILDSWQKAGIYFLLFYATLTIGLFSFHAFSWDSVADLIPGFMKNFKLERFRRGRRTKVRYNSLIPLLDLISPEKAIIPLTACLSLFVSISFLYDNTIGLVAITLFTAIYYAQHLALESKAKAQLANSISAQSFFLDSYRSLTAYSQTARKNRFLDSLKDYWQSLSESYAVILYEKDQSALWYQTRLALIKIVLVQLVFLAMVLLLGLNYLDFVSFSAIQIALTVITGPTHDLFKRLKNYTHFPVLSSMFTTNETARTIQEIQTLTTIGLKIFGQVAADINFNFKSNQIYSIIGKSGSGKSELAKVLSSMTTFTHGSLVVNDQKLNPGDLWRIKSIFISEVLHWRGGKIIEYLTARDPSPNLARLRSICRDLGIDHKIMQLPNAYETEVGEINLPFSHAEEMFLSLTRSIYADYKIIVLDNVLSRADRAFQIKVMDFVRKNLEGRIVLIIDNNYEIISDTDYSLVMENGAICDHGPSLELIIVSDKLKCVSRPTKYFL